MEDPQKELRIFYASHTKEQLQKEIAKDEIALCAETPRITGVADQRSVEIRIAILKELAGKHQA